MSVAAKAPPGHVRLHRAPLVDPPFDDELTPTTYRPLPLEPRLAMPAAAVAGASPECHTAALKFLNFCLELFNGFRSPAQMRPLVALEQALSVLDELARALRRLVDCRKQRPAQSGRVRRSQVRTFEPRAGVAEVAAVLNDGQRSFALAYRLERHTSVWKCTALVVILK